MLMHKSTQFSLFLLGLVDTKKNKQALVCYWMKKIK